MLWWTLSVAWANPEDCAHILHTRALAREWGLDERTLNDLEARYCGGEVALAPASRQACDELGVLATLARVEADVPWLVEVTSAREVACSGLVAPGNQSWSSGATARYANGARNYPNGATARYANGAWNYPNGTTARYANGAWNYPSGATARYANGQWLLPDGSMTTEADLLTASCATLPHPVCMRRLRDLGELPEGDARDAAVVTLAWEALGRR